MHPTLPTRLTFIDNLRIMLTMLVVAHHAAQPYGPTGGEWPIFDIGPFAKFGLVTLIGIPMSFAFSSLLRRLPWVKAIVL
ncbi:MAG: hypothetical protein AAGF01_20950 [Cyanobacteria bacterium P01_G01_bin.38]